VTETETESCPEEPWHDPHFLRVAYWGRGQSINAIADSCGVSHTTILHYMEQHEIPRRGRRGTRKISREELIDSIQRAAEEIDGVPSTADHQRHGACGTTTVKQRFGSWPDALLAAGVLGDD
jgi:hypothetical protein